MLYSTHVSIVTDCHFMSCSIFVSIVSDCHFYVIFHICLHCLWLSFYLIFNIFLNCLWLFVLTVFLLNVTAWYCPCSISMFQISLFPWQSLLLLYIISPVCFCELCYCVFTLPLCVLLKIHPTGVLCPLIVHSTMMLYALYYLSVAYLCLTFGSPNIF